MNVLPVINRELRAQARHPFTYWLRVLGAGTVLVAAILFVLRNGARVDRGDVLFIQLHATIHAAIWILVPLLVADSLSRERREGTLGLLFLTPLRAVDIVTAKGLVNGLRAVSLLCAVLPIITLPLLMGGITWQQAASSLVVNLAALCFALAAGILASALSKSWTRALILAYFLTGALFLVHLTAAGAAATVTFATGGFDINESMAGVYSTFLLNPEEYSAYYYWGSGYRMFAPPSPRVLGLDQGILIVTGVVLLVAMLALVGAALLAALLTRNNWRQKTPSPQAEKMRATFTTPVVGSRLLRGWMRRSLNRNPIGWLERRSWSGRIVIWGWFAVMISIYSLLLTSPTFLTRGFREIHIFMGWSLVAGLALSASMSFRRERENRVLELLLVSPLRELQIIFGRLRGLWGQFLPSIGLLLTGWTFLCLSVRAFEDQIGDMLAIVAGLAAIPVMGLYFSLICRNFLTALLLTILVGFILPSVQLPLTQLAAIILRGVADIDSDWLRYLSHPAFFQLAVATLLFWRLHRRLVHRNFATETT